MSYTYATFKTALAEMIVVEESNAEYNAILPSIVDYAEQRIYRELDLLSSTVVDATSSLTAGSRTAPLPTSTGTYVVVSSVAVITPVGASVATGTRNVLTPVSLDTLNMLWSSSTTGVPEIFAMQDQDTIVVGPVPDASYIFEVVGTQRPMALSASNTTTFLSQNLPDLFMAAAMVFASGYMRNFGSQADDPKMGASWEGQYQTLKASAMVEEMRKKFMSSTWSSQAPAPLATPARN